MYFVTKGKEQAKVLDKPDAVALVNSLNQFDCIDPTNKKELIGTQIKGEDIYTLSYEDYKVNIVDLDNTLTVIRWLLSLKHVNITVESRPYEN